MNKARAIAAVAASVGTHGCSCGLPNRRPSMSTSVTVPALMRCHILVAALPSILVIRGAAFAVDLIGQSTFKQLRRQVEVLLDKFG